MKANEADSPTQPAVSPLQYQVLCAVALAAICLIELQQGLLVWALVVVLLGSVGVLLRARISPLLILVPIVAGQLYLQYLFPAVGPRGVLRVEDVVLCAATLAYLAGHYRLIALWRNILPVDPRQRYHRHAGVIVPTQRMGRVAPQHRPAMLLSRTELAWFLVQLPVFVLVAQMAWIVLGAPRQVLGFSPRWLLFLQFAWFLVLTLFLAAQLFRLVRLWRMDVASAKMLLQDALWQETRGEQRRIGRWLAWWKLRR